MNDSDINERHKMLLLARPCPYCLTLCVKIDDEDCDHVKCKCGCEFCYSCSAKRSPIIAHGNHYHRQKCNAFFAYNGFDNSYSSECSECKRLGKLCSPPVNLDPYNDIPFSERIT